MTGGRVAARPALGPSHRAAASPSSRALPRPAPSGCRATVHRPAQHPVAAEQRPLARGERRRRHDRSTARVAAPAMSAARAPTSRRPDRVVVVHRRPDRRASSAGYHAAGSSGTVTGETSRRTPRPAAGTRSGSCRCRPRGRGRRFRARLEQRLAETRRGGRPPARASDPRCASCRRAAARRHEQRRGAGSQRARERDGAGAREAAPRPEAEHEEVVALASLVRRASGSIPHPSEAPAFRLRYAATPSVPQTAARSAHRRARATSRRIARSPDHPQRDHATVAATRAAT